MDPSIPQLVPAIMFSTAQRDDEALPVAEVVNNHPPKLGGAWLTNSMILVAMGRIEAGWQRAEERSTWNMIPPTA
jgi:hypothetical protein